MEAEIELKDLGECEDVCVRWFKERKSLTDAEKLGAKKPSKGKEETWLTASN